MEGDSIPPYQDGAYIIGQYIEDITDMTVGKTYLLVTRDGFIFKRLEIINKASIIVKSDNPFYANLEIPFHDLKEIWLYAESFTNREQKILDGKRRYQKSTHKANAAN